MLVGRKKNKKGVFCGLKNKTPTRLNVALEGFTENYKRKMPS